MAKFVCSMVVWVSVSLGVSQSFAASQICDSYQQCLSEENSKRYNSAIAYLKQGRWQQAFTLFEPLYLEATSHQLVVNNYAAVLTELGHKAEAAWILEQYLASHEQLGASFRNLMQAYENLALAGTAAETLTVSLELMAVPEAAPSTALPRLATATSQESSSQKMSVGPHSDEQQLQTVSQRLKAFAEDWSAGDVSKYFSYYWPDQSPVNSVSYSQWRQQRAMRISPEREIRVQVNSVAAYYRGEGEIVTDFVQYYRAKNYQDSVNKRLIWKKRDKQWLIVSESNI